MNLLFALNGGYIPTFLNCMRSVLLHGGASHYEVFILHSDLTPADEERVRAALPEVGLHFVFVDPAMFDGFPESKRYPRQIYYRIAAPLLLPDTLERILYLDADTVIINPLTQLYAAPFGDAYFMACTHTHKLLEKLKGIIKSILKTIKAQYTIPGITKNIPSVCISDSRHRKQGFAAAARYSPSAPLVIKSEHITDIINGQRHARQSKMGFAQSALNKPSDGCF